VFNVTEEPRQPGPLYRLSIAHVFGSCLGALALGIARGSIDVFTNVIREIHWNSYERSSDPARANCTFRSPGPFRQSVLL
jgi:hypothetical protein